MVRNAEIFKGLDMGFVKRFFIALVMLTFLCAAVFAQQDIMDTYINGDTLNRKIQSYANNIISLIPDTTTLQNIWAIAPDDSFYLGVGINGCLAFLDRTQVSNIATGFEALAESVDLTRFPDSVPFLPAVTFDARIGFGSFDFGLAGTWLDETILEENELNIFGQGSTFALQSLGMDFRYSINDKLSLPKILPIVALQAGYYFTRTTFGIQAEDTGKTESVKVDFRNDTLLLGVHISKSLMANMLVPYAGIRVFFSTTHSDYEWSTNRPVMTNGRLFYNGAKYKSATIMGDTEVSSQFYAGAGINFVTYAFTVGGAYNLDTEHFSINLSFRYFFGI